MSAGKAARGRWRGAVVGVGLVLVVLGGALGWHFGWQQGHVGPPAIDLEGIDPPVVAMIEQARAAVRKEPRSPRAWGQLGKVLLANGFDDPADLCFAEAERLGPEEPRWPYFRARRRLLRDREAGLRDLLRAVELCDRFDKRNTTPRLILTAVYLEKGMYAEARADCRRVLEQEPNNPLALFGLGVATFSLGDLAGSIEPLSRAAASPFTRKRAYTQLAAVSQRMGNATAAAEFSRKAKEPPEDRPWPDPYVAEYRRLAAGRQDRFLEAENLEAKGRLPESAALLREIAQDFPDDRSHAALGVVLVKLGDYRGAEKVLREALRQAPNMPATHYALCLALYRQGEAAEKSQGSVAAQPYYRAAVSSAEQTVRLKPDHGMAYLVIGQARRGLGQRAAALDALRKAVRCRPDFVEPHLRLGEALAEAGLEVEARKELQFAVQLAPASDARPRQALARLRPKGK